MDQGIKRKLQWIAFAIFVPLVLVGWWLLHWGREVSHDSYWVAGAFSAALFTIAYLIDRSDARRRSQEQRRDLRAEIEPHRIVEHAPQEWPKARS